MYIRTPAQYYDASATCTCTCTCTCIDKLTVQYSTI